MYHLSNLGMFDHPREFADIEGYVPEPGDDWRDMRYDLGEDDPARWRRKIEELEEDIKDAQLSLHGESDNEDRESIWHKLTDLNSDLDHCRYMLDASIDYLDHLWWPKTIAGAVKATRIANACLAKRSGDHYGQLAAAAIVQAGSSQRQVAEAIGISQPNLNQRLSRGSVSAELIGQIAQAIGWTIPEVIGE